MENHAGIGHEEAMEKVTSVLCDGVKTITDLMFVAGEINLDFEDVKTVMKNGGHALFASGEAEGEGKALQAVKNALENPLFEDINRKGAHSVLINIYGDSSLKMDEVFFAKRCIDHSLDWHYHTGNH